MNKLFAIISLLVGTTAAQAYDYPYLVVQSADGTTKSIAVESLVLTFQDGQLVATNGDGTQSFTLTDLSKMYFTSSTTAISQVAEQEEGPVEVYALSGMFVGRYDTLSAARANLKQGVYLMKTKGTTKKVAIK
jgi:hypothetical protein